ncbi:von Willebrand factor A domain-containing protein 5A-like [Clupea harengus]|uniref:von Willebrand factor A domain-containing protein 5A-like n=1 Tax=Clupea harengus TaxID=7950 RepID=A0A6P8FQR1_CLUHA|nr:von Willebrand factor A domain-containing protein 5A-like [Clupea harengus]
MVNCCGLVTVKNEPVPLKSVAVDVRVQGHVATVTSTLLYVNGEERPLEAVFVFPLPGECALCHFSAKLGDTEVVAKLQDKQKAREQYDDALSSGHQAFLLEESDQSPDMFQLNVGSLPPGESAAITLVYISELAMQADDALRFCLPAVLNPRYTPQEMDRSKWPLGVQLWLWSHWVYLNADKTQATVSLSSGHVFDRDVELLLYYQDAHNPTAIVEGGQDSAEPGSLMGDPVVMLSFYPEFPAAVTSSLATCGEFIFVVDRSGSMDCRMHSGKNAKMRIESARDTLLLLLKSLPMGCFFNIYGFGSRFESFFPKSVEYKQKTMDEALQKVNGMRADMGGTNILEPLKHLYSQPCIPSHPRQLFIFTDGEVGNTKQVVDLVKMNVNSHRCFSFGIGEGASTALINGLAQEGSGHAQFITGTDRMQPKVMQSLRYALQPAVKDISVDWDLPDGVSVTTLSPPLKVLFHGQRALLYAQLEGESSGNPEGSVTIQYNLLEETVKNQLGFCLKPTGDTGETLHRLGARALIRLAGVCVCLNTVSELLCMNGFIFKFTFIHLAEMFDCAMLDEEDGFDVVQEPESFTDPLLQLISLQKASGSWEMDSSMAKVLVKSDDDLAKLMPLGADKAVWATTLALIWLYGSRLEARDEWQFVAMKAASWIQAQKVGCVSQCVQAGNALLGCQVQQKTLGL